MTLEDEMATIVGSVSRHAFETVQQDQKQHLARGNTLTGYAQDAPSTSVTLSSVMGRLQAAIERTDMLIKKASITAQQLAGETPSVLSGAEGPATPKRPDGTLYQADDMVSMLSRQIDHLQNLFEMVAHRLS